MANGAWRMANDRPVTAAFGHLEVFLAQTTTFVGLAAGVGGGAGRSAVWLAHHILEHALLLGIERGQMDVARGTKMTAIIQMLVLQPYIIPYKATTEQRKP